MVEGSHGDCLVATARLLAGIVVKRFRCCKPKWQMQSTRRATLALAVDSTTRPAVTLPRPPRQRLCLP